MTLVPFKKEEMETFETIPGFPGCPSRNVFDAPITPRENLLRALRREDVMYFPNTLDMAQFHTRLIPDNKARGTVMDGFGPFTPSEEGELDAFGVNWLFDPVIMGSMEDPNQPHMLEFADEWEDNIVFPEPETWDWQGAADASVEMRCNDKWALQCTIFTGFFERLISFMGFENAAVALIDDEQKEDVHALFDKVTSYYEVLAVNFKKYFGCDVLEFHDDWGSKQSTFFSYDTVMEMIVPYMKRLCKTAHENGMATKLHSCGKIEPLIPCMIEAGVDLWMGQDLNDKPMLVKEYGDKICIEVEVPEVGEDATDEEVWAAAEKFADDYIIPGKYASIGIYSVGYSNRPLLTDAIYEISRKRYCGVAE